MTEEVNQTSPTMQVMELSWPSARLQPLPTHHNHGTIFQLPIEALHLFSLQTCVEEVLRKQSRHLFTTQQCGSHALGDFIV